MRVVAKMLMRITKKNAIAWWHYFMITIIIILLIIIRYDIDDCYTNDQIKNFDCDDW